MADVEVELFGFPLSYYTQKANIALEEKRIPFKWNYVEDFYTPDYLRVNPLGQIPAIKVREKILAGSDDIISFLDTIGDNDVRLVPDPTTPEGQLVTEWRKKIDALPVAAFTYGVIFNPSLSVTGVDFPVKTDKDTFIGFLTKNICRMEGYYKTEPELKESCDAIIARFKQRLAMSDYLKEDGVKKVLDGLELLLDDAEQLLKKHEWLCGPTFTAADIHFAVFFRRLIHVGLDKRYTPTRPALTQYWDRASKRPSVKKCIFDQIASLDVSIHPLHRGQKL